MIYRGLYILGGARCLPSTVFFLFSIHFATSVFFSLPLHPTIQNWILLTQPSTKTKNLKIFSSK